MSGTHPVTQATLALDRAGIAWTPHTYTHDSRATSYGLEAAEALGFDPARVFKTLVVTMEGKPGLAIIPVSCSLNLKAAAGVLVSVGAPKARSAAMADSRLAQAATGYVLGGISPVGTKRALPTALDASAMDLSTMLVSGGRRGFDIELAPEDLKNLLRAAVGDLKR